LDDFTLEATPTPKLPPKKGLEGKALKAHPGASLPPGFQVKPFKAFKDGNRTWIWNEPENPPKSI
jgi:hypothetical protein